MKILVAVDGSDSSLAAVDALVSRIGWFAQRPHIVLAYVHPPLPYPGAKVWVGRDNVEKYYHDEADAIFARTVQRLEPHGIASERVMLVGDAAQEIARHASSSGCDLIAMGTHGHSGLGSLVLGSVAMKILASAKVPVLFPR